VCVGVLISSLCEWQVPLGYYRVTTRVTVAAVRMQHPLVVFVVERAKGRAGRPGIRGVEKHPRFAARRPLMADTLAIEEKIGEPLTPKDRRERQLDAEPPTRHQEADGGEGVAAMAHKTLVQLQAFDRLV